MEAGRMRHVSARRCSCGDGGSETQANVTDDEATTGTSSRPGQRASRSTSGINAALFLLKSRDSWLFKEPSSLQRLPSDPRSAKGNQQTAKRRASATAVDR